MLALHSRKSNIYWAKILEKWYFENNDREVAGLNNKLIYFFLLNLLAKQGRNDKMFIILEIKISTL